VTGWKRIFFESRFFHGFFADLSTYSLGRAGTSRISKHIESTPKDLGNKRGIFGMGQSSIGELLVGGIWVGLLSGVAVLALETESFYASTTKIHSAIKDLKCTESILNFKNSLQPSKLPISRRTLSKRYLGDVLVTCHFLVIFTCTAFPLQLWHRKTTPAIHLLPITTNHQPRDYSAYPACHAFIRRRHVVNAQEIRRGPLVAAFRGHRDHKTYEFYDNDDLAPQETAAPPVTPAYTYADCDW